MKLSGLIKISFIILLFFLVGCNKDENLTSKAVLEGEESLVVEVIDGDTFELDNGIHVRMLGINTPEVNEDYYQEAKDELKKLILNKTVLLVRDKQDKDKYGRDLRYVYVDNLFANSYLVENGYAKTLSIEPNTKYTEEFAFLEREAIDNSKGLWGIEQRNVCIVLGCEEGTKYVASKSSKVYYDCDCKKTARLRVKEVKCFSEIPEGYTKSKSC
ncbi:thermonuclease family protein [Candidatus Woesearchaeota archaeon]|nr:thermonuclease family protein [Candidatus Woesearchaeota archaeon]